MTHIRTIAAAAKEIKRNDPDTAITEYRIRALVNERHIPYIAAGNRKLIRTNDVIDYFNHCMTG